MRCLITCTAESYDIRTLFEALKQENDVSLIRGVIQFGNTFIFPYGCTVCWGDESALSSLKPFEKTPLERPSIDSFPYSFGDTAKVVNGEIILPDQQPITLLAVSHALAQSVKLDVFELRIQKTVDATRHIPREMAAQGKVSLSRKEIRKKMGELFIERNSINLHFDILDKPEFFWEYPEVEYLYNMTAHYLDIETRVEVLNQRLGVIQELFDMLNNALNHAHSSRLEWTIIILILIEVTFTLFKEFV